MINITNKLMLKKLFLIGIPCLLLWVSPQLSAESLSNLKNNVNVESTPSAIKLFKDNEQRELADIGKVELIKYQCFPFYSLSTKDKANTKAQTSTTPTPHHNSSQNNNAECVVLWQWMDGSRWDVNLSIIDAKGNTLASENFGRSAMLLAIVPYSSGALIIIEHAVQQKGDVSCCPSKMYISTYRWFQDELQQLSQSELAETNRHF